MTNQPGNGINRSNLSSEFLSQERQKSSLILEANLLKEQGLFESASKKFAAAAIVEEELTNQLLALKRYEKAFVHQFSAISCWAQAGNLHRALTLGDALLADPQLPERQREQISRYMDILHGRFQQWMKWWITETAVSHPTPTT